MLKGELYYHVAHAHLQEQDQRNRDFDLKAAGCLGIATTITGMGAILLNGFLNNSSREMTTLSLVFIALSALVYICTLGCGLLVMRLREWRFDPDLSKFAAYLPDYGDEAFVEWAGDQFKNPLNPAARFWLERRGSSWPLFCLRSPCRFSYLLLSSRLGSKSRLFFSVSGASGGLRRGLGFGGGGLGSAIQCLPFRWTNPSRRSERCQGLVIIPQTLASQQRPPFVYLAEVRWSRHR